MAKYSFSKIIKINLGDDPSAESIKAVMDAGYDYNRPENYWWAEADVEKIKIAREISGVTGKNFGLKVKIRDIVSANNRKLLDYLDCLKDLVNEISKNSGKTGKVGTSQIKSWWDCFQFIKKQLNDLSETEKNFDLIFEYCLPDTYEKLPKRPDVILLTDKKVICLEFKRKDAPQTDGEQNDVQQAGGYKDLIQKYHAVTKDKGMEVKVFLVCTGEGANSENIQGIEILTQDNFRETIQTELKDQECCSFCEEWLASSGTKLPDLLQAIYDLYHNDNDPLLYMKEVNPKCKNAVRKHIDDARSGENPEVTNKLLIFINGVPGSGKTAVGQSIVYEENHNPNGKQNAVYISGNDSLVEVLRAIIKNADHNIDPSCVIQSVVDFKIRYFDKSEIPEQSIIVYDEAQRAWDKNKMKQYNYDYSQPEGLLRVCDKIADRDKNGYVVLICLYGEGQFIEPCEKAGLSLWKDALNGHEDWTLIASSSITDSEIMKKIDRSKTKIVTCDEMYLSTSVRTDFIDYSKWVDQAISRENNDPERARYELENIYNNTSTPMHIYLTRNMEAVKRHCKEIKKNNWKYGLMVSNYACYSQIKTLIEEVLKMKFDNCVYRKKNESDPSEYASWFKKDCCNLDKVCNVYGTQGLEIDVPIIVFGGEYVRKGGKWIDPDPKEDETEKELILLIPDVEDLTETFTYFSKMGVEMLPDPSSPDTGDNENNVS